VADYTTPPEIKQSGRLGQLVFHVSRLLGVLCLTSTIDVMTKEPSQIGRVRAAMAVPALWVVALLVVFVKRTKPQLYGSVEIVVASYSGWVLLTKLEGRTHVRAIAMMGAAYVISRGFNTLWENLAKAEKGRPVGQVQKDA
jgi:hypothetical protein